MMEKIKPNLTVLSADNIQQVHETALIILGKTGLAGYQTGGSTDFC